MLRPIHCLAVLVRRRRGILLGLALSLTGCSGSSPVQPMPSALPTTPSPPPLPAPPLPPPVPTTACEPNRRGPALPALAACCVAPNYVGEQPPLDRWAQFPLRVSIDRASLTVAGSALDDYEAGIRLGTGVWALATGGSIGETIVDFDLPAAELSIRLIASDPDDAECRLLQLCYEGVFNATIIEDDRVLRRGEIVLVRDQIERSADIVRNLREYVAGLVGHEMGHALGMSIHSPDPADLMYERWPRAIGRPYPWASEADINSLNTAYCR